MSKVAAIAKLTAGPGQRDQLIAALDAALENAQSEAGTLLYILHEDQKDADVVWFYETYADQDAAVAHGTSDAFKALGPKLAPFLAGRPEITMLKPIGGKGF